MLSEVADDPGNMFKPIESLVNVARREYDISYLGVRITEDCMEVVILESVLHLTRDITSKFVLGMLTSAADMLL